MVIVTAILLAISCLLWLGVVANALTIHSSDPAGRGLAVAYGAVNGGLLLLAMAAAFAACGVAGRAPAWLLMCGVVVVPAACAACVSTLALIGRHGRMRWVSGTVIVGPGILHALIAWCLWWRIADAPPRAAELSAVAVVAVCAAVPFVGHWLAPRMRSRHPRPERGDGDSSVQPVDAQVPR
jgi:hypothetical protein